MEPTPKRTRIRKRSLRTQLELALRDAEAAATADISTQKLVQTRLAILNKMLAREQNQKARRNAEELVTLRAEIEQLRSQHEQDKAEIARLRAACKIESHGSFDEIVSRRTNGK